MAQQPDPYAPCSYHGANAIREGAGQQVSKAKNDPVFPASPSFVAAQDASCAQVCSLVIGCYKHFGQGCGITNSHIQPLTAHRMAAMGCISYQSKAVLDVAIALHQLYWEHQGGVTRRSWPI
jgi:hypothetical protein